MGWSSKTQTGRDPVKRFALEQHKNPRALNRRPFKMDVTGRGERGYPKIVTNGDISGGEYAQMVTSPLCICEMFTFRGA